MRADFDGWQTGMTVQLIDTDTALEALLKEKDKSKSKDRKAAKSADNNAADEDDEEHHQRINHLLSLRCLSFHFYFLKT